MEQTPKTKITMAIVSDLHVMAPELLISKGGAFEQYLAEDRKMLCESPEILNTIVEDILELRPELTLIPGDLTKDGERVSHQLVVSQLQRLVDAGIQVLVVPGNHDINNPDAKSYDGDSVAPVETVTRNEFAEFYRNMGYDERSRRDADTLSYSRDVGERLTFIGIDACMDRFNTFVSRGDARDHCKASGHLESSTRQWIVSEAIRAREAGRRVIAMMHHHLVPHFHMEDTLAAPYMVDEAAQLCHQLIDAGVHVIFTGHLHISDISASSRPNGRMVEVATAAAVGYPCQWRVVTCNPVSGKMMLHTRTLFALPSVPDFGERAYSMFAYSIPTITRGLLTRYWTEITQAIENYSNKHSFMMRYVSLPSTPEALADLLLKHLQEPITRAYLAFAEGNEGDRENDGLIGQLIDGVDHVVDETVRGILRPFAKAALRLRVYSMARKVLRSILEDRNDIGTPNEAVINDHTAIIDF